MTRYRRVLAVALFGFTAIVISGALVRLTSSGLGCEDWPQCSEDELVPEWAFHSWVEFGNRLFSGVIGLGALALVWATRRFGDKELMPWAWGVLAGTVAQVIVGAITVKTELNPYSVTIHFLLSMALIWGLLVMWVRTSPQLGDESDRSQTPSQLRSSSTVLGIWASVVLLTGTIVTGTGPNGGDTRADRLSLDIQSVAQLHSVTVWILLAGFLWVTWQAHRLLESGDPRTAWLRAVLALILAQGGVGYLQYALGVPAWLVLIHVIGSLAIWCSVVWLSLVFNTSRSLRYY